MSKDLGEALAKQMGVTSEKQLAGLLRTVLQGRGQTADNVAQVAPFVCSDRASAITGQALNVDGGTAFY
jgi:enoyl-[acyl-carrier-protein] reductase (NADH)